MPDIFRLEHKSKQAKREQLYAAFKMSFYLIPEGEIQEGLSLTDEEMGAVYKVKHEVNERFGLRLAWDTSMELWDYAVSFGYIEEMVEQFWKEDNKEAIISHAIYGKEEKHDWL